MHREESTKTAALEEIMPLEGKPTGDFEGHRIPITFPVRTVVHNHREYDYDLGDRIILKL